MNATMSGNNIIYRKSVNIGIAVDLDPGLIVPVIKDADDLSLPGVAKRINDLAARARSRQLNPDEIQGATFSITNPGVLGTLVGMPVIPKGTAAILGTGAIEKRPVVVEDPETGNALGTSQVVARWLVRQASTQGWAPAGPIIGARAR